MRKIPLTFACAGFLAILSGFATAHEFWIDPFKSSYTPGEEISAELRVGQMMRGSSQSYAPDRIKQMGVVFGDKAQPLSARLGDRPAVKLSAAGDGLHVFAVETNASTLAYQTFDKFQTFVETHGQPFAVEAHRAANLPQEAFREGYFRFAKSLVKVGDGAGTDMSVRFPFELVALDNPYSTKDEIRMALLYGGKPVPNHQVDVFRRPVGAATDADRTLYQTDAEGVVRFPIGTGEFLINAVKLERPSDQLAEALDVVWISLWASTTFVIE